MILAIDGQNTTVINSGTTLTLRIARDQSSQISVDA